jgi:hypothetical protein
MLQTNENEEKKCHHVLNSQLLQWKVRVAPDHSSTNWANYILIFRPNFLSMVVLNKTQQKLVTVSVKEASMWKEVSKLNQCFCLTFKKMEIK